MQYESGNNEVTCSLLFWFGFPGDMRFAKDATDFRMAFAFFKLGS